MFDLSMSKMRAFQFFSVGSGSMTLGFAVVPVPSIVNDLIAVDWIKTSPTVLRDWRQGACPGFPAASKISRLWEFFFPAPTKPGSAVCQPRWLCTWRSEFGASSVLSRPMG